MEDKSTPFTGTLASHLLFLRAALLRQRQMGTIFPSQRFLISKMISPVPHDYSGEVLELGAGNGALTLRLAERCPKAQVRACEINRSLARAARQNLALAGFADRVQVAAASAQDFLARQATPPAFIISGIPLGNLGKAATEHLVRQIHQTLAPGGLYIQFQYLLVDRRLIRSQFRAMRTLPAFLNLPPAFVYFARK